MQRRSGSKKAGAQINKKLILFGSAFLFFAVLLGISVYLNYLLDIKRHPIKYEREVLQASEKHGTDPLLVFSVILIESRFIPGAVSRAGARGLMQIMPETGEWIAWHQNTEYDENKLFEPVYNIDFGCYLLSYLLEHYNNNTEFALAAYNAGKTAVDGWLKDGVHMNGKHLTIPYAETRDYVKKVQNAYEKYKRLYGENYGGLHGGNYGEPLGGNHGKPLGGNHGGLLGGNYGGLHGGNYGGLHGG